MEKVGFNTSLTMKMQRYEPTALQMLHSVIDNCASTPGDLTDGPV